MTDIPIQTVSTEKSFTYSPTQAGEVPDGIGAAYWDFVVAQGVIDVGANFIIAYGYEADEFFPLTLDKWASVVHPEDRYVLLAFEKMVNGQADAMDITFRMQTPTGEWRYFRSRGNVVEINPINNMPLRLSGTIRDVTDLKVADFAFRHALQHRDQLLTAVNQAVKILSATDSQNFDHSITKVLHILGTASKVDHV